MALAVVGDVAAWIGRDIDSTRQGELTACIAAAQAWVATQAGLRSLEKEASAVTTYLDASSACGEELWLPNDVRPLWHSGSDLLTVTEGGVSVTVSVAYSSTAGAIIRNANTFKRACLVRVGGWARSGANDVAVTCKVGWHLDTGVLIVPQDVRRLVIECSWLIFNSASWSGIQSISKAGASVTMANDLSPAGRDTLDRLPGV